MTEQRQPTPFARIIATPILLLIAALLIGMVIPGSLMPAVLIAAVVGVVYVFWAARR